MESYSYVPYLPEFACHCFVYKLCPFNSFHNCYCCVSDVSLTCRLTLSWDQIHYRIHYFIVNLWMMRIVRWALRFIGFYQRRLKSLNNHWCNNNASTFSSIFYSRHESHSGPNSNKINFHQLTFLFSISQWHLPHQCTIYMEQAFWLY